MRCVILAVLLVSPAVQDDPKECCKETAKAHYCDKCRKILSDADCRQVDFEGDEFTACKICAKANGDDVVAHARARANEIEICDRVYYQCDGESLGCGKVRREPGECCGKERVKKTHRARVYYVCPDCEKQWGNQPMWRMAEWQQQAQGHGGGWLKDKPGECPRHNCRLEQRCSMAGFFPHTPSK